MEVLSYTILTLKYILILIFYSLNLNFKFPIIWDKSVNTIQILLISSYLTLNSLLDQNKKWMKFKSTNLHSTSFWYFGKEPIGQLKNLLHHLVDIEI